LEDIGTKLIYPSALSFSSPCLGITKSLFLVFQARFASKKHAPRRREEFKFHSLSSLRLASRFRAFAAHSVLAAAQCALRLCV